MKQFKKSFTLIETIVVVAVIGLTLPIIFSIFFVLLQQQTKVFRLNAVKKEGDYIVNLIDNTVRDRAVTILSSTSPIPPTTNKVCFDDLNPFYSASNLYFLDKDGIWFGYEQNSDTLASASAGQTSINLTSPKIRVSSFSISCSRTNVYSQPSISLSFNIDYCADVACSQTRPEEIASLHYQTRIKLRNY
ncbi:MAG: type II secretion system protein [Patescibacteria group bacterium]|jgi:type II secretory pathway pseudopilin PulG